ncbi:MAG: hypothetical protein HUK02_01500 [Bacteroidaceae bacterium]|nr:hypothetical protein [Bacteroidaceae bacterium]
MCCKLNLFKERADEFLCDEKLSRYVKHNSLLKLMTDNFTFGQFVKACVQLGCRKQPNGIRSCYLLCGKIVKIDDYTFKKRYKQT